MSHSTFVACAEEMFPIAPCPWKSVPFGLAYAHARSLMIWV
jgi:hypothetical protein